MESRSAFFSRLGFPLRNIRQSWGARSDLGVLLITWEDDLDGTKRFARVLGPRAKEQSGQGLNERVDHLRILWSGGLAGYTVLAKARDTKTRPREIASYDGENVRAIISLVAQPDGSIWAELGDDVPVRRLKKHAANHRLIPGEGAFPVTRRPSKTFGASSAAYIAKLPAMRQWLIDVARRGSTVTYAEARVPFGMRSLEHRHAMDRIGHECVDAGEPILTSLIVDEKTGRCSKGFIKEFRRDDNDERQDCYAFWSPLNSTLAKSIKGRKAAKSALGKSHAEESLQARAARFARAAVRPDQAAFRRRVFMEHKGSCVVTGCSIPEALDAAHREGRNWRLGHNSAADGLLLRKDIHALYDAKLISIDQRGAVVARRDVEVHYRDYLRKS